MNMDEERIYTLTFISRPFLSDNYRTVETIDIRTENCVTLSEVVECFNRMLKVMGFQSEVDIVDENNK